MNFALAATRSRVGDRRSRSVVVAAAVMLLIIVGSVPAGAQVGNTGSRRPMTLSFGMDLSSWAIDLPGVDRYTQTVMPVAYVLPFGERLKLEMSAHPFRSSFSRTGGLSDVVNSFGDTRVRAAYRLGRDFGLAVLSVGVPTGSGEINTLAEARNAALAADRRFDNPVTSFGTGLVVNGTVAAARPFGSLVLGGGIGYSYRAEYDLGDSLTSYDPGDEINLTFGVDQNFKLGNRPAQITGDLVYTIYSDDQRAGASIFEVGEKIVGEGRMLFATGPIDPWIVLVRYRSRGDSRDLRGTASTPFQAGDEVEAELTARLPLREGLVLDLNTMLRSYAEADDGSGGADLFGVGCGVRARLRPGLVLQPAALFQFGEIDQIGVTGIRLQVGLTMRL